MHRQPHGAFVCLQNSVGRMRRDQEGIAAFEGDALSIQPQYRFPLQHRDPLILVLIVDDRFDLVGADDADDFEVFVFEKGGEGFAGFWDMCIEEVGMSH